jgi:hypothetical protein
MVLWQHSHVGALQCQGALQMALQQLHLIYHRSCHVGLLTAVCQ